MITWGLVSRLIALLTALLVAPIAGGSGTLLSAAASAAPATYTYDASAYAYDALARSSSPDSVASYVRGSPPASEVASWVSHVSIARDGVAADTGAGAVGSGVARMLTAAEQRSVASLQRQVAACTEKLEAYRASPDAFDTLGYLERAPSPESMVRSASVFQVDVTRTAGSYGLRSSEFPGLMCAIVPGSAC